MSRDSRRCSKQEIWGWRRPTAYKVVRPRVRKCLSWNAQCRSPPYIYSTYGSEDFLGREGTRMPR